MSTDNPIASSWSWYKQHIPSPLASALLLGGLTYGAGRLAWGPVVETVRALGRPFVRKGNAKNTAALSEWDESMDELKNNSRAKNRVPLMAGAVMIAAGLMATYRPRERHYGLLDWDAPMVHITNDRHLYYKPQTKTAALNLTSPYTAPIDWNKPINQRMATGLFNNDPHLSDDPYVRNFGTSIINNAAISNHTRTPTLGNIFDSAVDKINKKLSFGGMLGTATQAVLANGASRLFASALDTMVGLSPGVRQGIVDAGTWAGTITSILN